MPADAGRTGLVARERAELGAAAELNAARAALRQAETRCGQLEDELERVHAARECEARERRRLEAELNRREQDHLWAWAEEELRRVQGSLQRTRDKLYQAEEELAATRNERDAIEQRQRRTEEELQRVREELQGRRREVARPQGGPSNGIGVTAGSLSAARSPSAPAIRSRVEGVVRAAYNADDDQGTWHRTPDSIINWSDALAAVGGRPELLRATAKAFFEECPRTLNDLRSAIEREEPAEIEILTRQLTRAARSLGARSTLRALKRLEAVARYGVVVDTEEAYIAVQLEIELLKSALEPFRGQSSARG